MADVRRLRDSTVIPGVTGRPGAPAPVGRPAVAPRELRLAGAWLALVVVAELVYVVAGLVPGLVAGIVALAWLLVAGLLRPGAADGRAALALAVIPLLRVLSIALPSLLVPRWIWYAEIGIGVILATFMVARALRLRRGDLFIRGAPTLEVAIAVVIGLALGLSLSLISGSEPVLPDRSPISMLVVSAVIVVGGAAAEELLLRGLILRVAGEIVPGAAVGVSTALTALLYLGTGSVPYVLVIALFAYVYGSATHRTNSLAPAIACHAVLLWSQLLLWPTVLG